LTKHKTYHEYTTAVAATAELSVSV